MAKSQLAAGLSARKTSKPFASKSAVTTNSEIAPTLDADRSGNCRITPFRRRAASAAHFGEQYKVPVRTVRLTFPSRSPQIKQSNSPGAFNMGVIAIALE